MKNRVPAFWSGFLFASGLWLTACAGAALWDHSVRFTSVFVMLMIAVFIISFSTWEDP